MAEAPTLLSGGNPQVPKGFGDAPVKAWIAAVPGWKSAAMARLDALVVASAPGVRKAVKWNSPLYGIDEGTWFLGVHAFDRYLKVSFFNGAALEPMPPETSKQKTVRYFHIREDEPMDEAQMADWIRQAAALPGEKM
ncbi:hypothetical protein GCM10009422_29120 [Brevundimonas kwangchunensis]|uniref:YdhG-like domain-containing protein n=1 Tax=Brevundimonas kwangchunensis TaxID=322163 RepID=A0ABN1H605_9CAUL